MKFLKRILDVFSVTFLLSAALMADGLLEIHNGWLVLVAMIGFSGFTIWLSNRLEALK